MPAGGSEERSDEEPARRAQRAERSEAIPAQREKKKEKPPAGEHAWMRGLRMRGLWMRGGCGWIATDFSGSSLISGLGVGWMGMGG